MIHFYLLIQASFLAGKVRDYVSRIKERPESQKEINKAHRLLFPVPLAHTFVAGKTRWILSLIIFVSLVIFPLITLIVAQIKFLPYQSGWITWQHRIIIIIDLILLWGFWYFIYISKNKNLRKEKLSVRYRNFVSSHPIISIAMPLSLLIVGFSIIVLLDFPGENPTLLQKLISEKIPNRFNLQSSTLVKKEPSPEILATYHIREDKSVTKLDESVWCEFAEPLNLSNRNFRKAKLSNTKICSANLTKADLTQAYLDWANLIAADLTRATLDRANLTAADLTKANLDYANLTAAFLWLANLTDTDLIQADLTRANLTDADLMEATLIEADLTQANLGSADLTETNLAEANLTRADLWQANLGWANLRKVNLMDADLTEANLTRANLWQANLIRADLGRANLIAADLLGADFTDADLDQADLFGVKISETNFTSARMINTNINYSWFWEDPGTENTKYLPVGIPKDWQNTLKPHYLCPYLFDIDDHVDFSKYANRRRKLVDDKLLEFKSRQDALRKLKSELRTELAEVIKEHCRSYKPKIPYKIP